MKEAAVQHLIMVPLSWYLALSAVLFTIGVAGVLVQRNVISIFMCIELMLNSVNLTLVAFSRFLNQSTGQLFVFIVIIVIISHNLFASPLV